MKLFVLAIRDRGTDSYGKPYCVRSVQEGIRAFADAVRHDAPENMINKHPEDYDLYLLGEFDDLAGSFECPVGRPQMIAVGKDLVPAV